MQVGARNLLEPGALIFMTYEQTEKPTRTAEERAALLEERRGDAEAALVERREAEAAFRANYKTQKAAPRALGVAAADYAYPASSSSCGSERASTSGFSARLSLRHAGLS